MTRREEPLPHHLTELVWHQPPTNLRNATWERESLKLTSMTAGYITLFTPLEVKGVVAIFEPCEGNTQARTLCLGVVQLQTSTGCKDSLFTIPYINVERESIEIDETKLMGTVQLCTAEYYPLVDSTIASIGTQGNSQVRTKANKFNGIIALHQ